MNEELLERSFRDLAEAIDDFDRVPYQNAPSILRRLAGCLQTQPLAGFLSYSTPSVDFEAWLKTAEGSRGCMVGSGTLEWPLERAERVAVQAALIERLASSEQQLFGFAHDFCHSGYNNIPSHYRRFSEQVLRPFLRDLKRLAEDRSLPPVLFEAIGALPSSGDAVVDQLMRDAVAKFKDVAPAARKEGLERLWDAWERLKSLDAQGNKRVSVSVLLDRAAPTEPFRGILETEARALTDIGNHFHIRHFETSTAPIEQEAHVDYLFHRLFALMHLLIYTRTR